MQFTCLLILILCILAELNKLASPASESQILDTFKQGLSHRMVLHKYAFVSIRTFIQHIFRDCLQYVAGLNKYMYEECDWKRFGSNLHDSVLQNTNFSLKYHLSYFKTPSYRLYANNTSLLFEHIMPFKYQPMAKCSYYFKMMFNVSFITEMTKVNQEYPDLRLI